MNFLEKRNGRCPKCSKSEMKHMKKEFCYSTYSSELSTEALYVLMTFQCLHCAYIFQEVFECQYRYTQEPNPWGNDFYEYPCEAFFGVDDFHCGECGINWGRSDLMRKNRDRCPFCGSDRINKN